MRNYTKYLLGLFLLLAASHVDAATIYVETTGCNTASTTQCSGTTDSATATISGTAASWTTGTSTITLDTNTDISGVAGCAAGVCDQTQAIFLNNATNAGRRIFWLTGYTGCTGSGSCDVTVSTTVSCSSCSGSDWGVGGRYIFPGGSTANGVEGGLRPLDVLQFNDTPATRTTAYFTGNMGVGSNAGYVFVRGKTGVRPVLELTAAAPVMTLPVNSLSHWSNLEIKGTGAAAALTQPTSGVVFYDIKFSGGGSPAIAAGTVTIGVYYSEFTGTTGTVDVIVGNPGGSFQLVGNYIHNNTTSGAAFRNTSVGPNDVLLNNIIVNNGGRGIYYNGSASSLTNVTIQGNIVYNNNNSGLEVTDADYTLFLYNNIFLDNGDTGTEYNVEYVAGNIDNRGSHGCNIFSIAGGRGGSNVTGLTLNATESTSSPAFTNAGSGDFSFTTSSPAYATGCPNTWPGLAGTTGYKSMGPVQLQAGSGPSSTRNDIRPGMN